MYFIMMVGLPASNKSSIAKELSKKYEAVIHSSDSIRKELFGNEEIQNDNTKVFQELHKRIKQDLSEGKSVIYDATNISEKRRTAFLKDIEKYGATKICYIAMKSYEKCVEDNLARERSVPEYVIRNMLMSFYIPQYREGWDEIRIIYADEPEIDAKSLYKLYDTFEQDNKYHSLTLGEHMKHTAELLVESYGDDEDIPMELLFAARWHDMGKPFTKIFKKKDGTSDGDAHYYGHENVGAYQYLMLHRNQVLPVESILEVCDYIQYHMIPYNIEMNSGSEKFIRKVGKEFYNNLIRLYEADRMAH